MTKKYVYFVSYRYSTDLLWQQHGGFGNKEFVLTNKIDSENIISNLEGSIEKELENNENRPFTVIILNFILLREECSMCGASGSDGGCPDCMGIQEDIPSEDDVEAFMREEE